jgi:dTMP kinase
MGLFVTFEGTEGSGKSTQIELLSKRLREHGREVIALREPGGTPIGEEIRHTLKHSLAGGGMCAETELLLMNASRAQLVRQVIRPALAAGKAVLCDRFFDSTIAYQVFGRRLDSAQVQRIIDFAIAGTRPDITLLLRIPLEISERRRAARAVENVRDRMEEEDREFFLRVEQGYDAIASNTATRVRPVDATLPVEEVAGEIWKWVAPLVMVPTTQGDRAWKTVGEFPNEGPG